MIFPDQLLRPKVRKISVFVLAFIDFGCSIHTRLPDAPVSKLNRPAGEHSVFDGQVYVVGGNDITVSF